MRIVVTGGSGFLGSRTVAAFAAAGHHVVSVDTTPPSEQTIDWRVADLRRREAPYEFLRGAEVLVHLANHSNARKADAQTVLAENTAMNVNVFQAASELGVRRVLFASSIQAMSDGPRPPSEAYPPPGLRQLPALPADGRTPARAGNAYGQSKIFGELLLADLSRLAGLETVAIRFPYITPDPRRDLRWRKPDSPHSGAEFHAWLWLEDAARLLIAAAEAPALPGFRIYLPTGPLPPDWPDAETLALTHLPDAPRREPGARLAALIDLSALEHDLAWSPTPWARLP